LTLGYTFLRTYEAMCPVHSRWANGETRESAGIKRAEL
jgi:hypothetical protein